MQGPIGVFDSGYGGLTILRDLRARLPQNDFLYLGDNARAPYGTRSFALIYEYTLQAVEHLFAQGCPLVILACNTASARALRTIQQVNLSQLDPTKRVLGIIRPVAEALAQGPQGDIGILATPGTVRSESYPIEIQKLDTQRQIFQRACPMWVPLVESEDFDHAGGEYFVQRDLAALQAASPQLKTAVLACTHYPILRDVIQRVKSPDLQIIEQGPIVAASLVDYLQRHPEMACRLSTSGSLTLQTTEDPEHFSQRAARFMGMELPAQRVELGKH
jgi:glutamate racemase